MFFSITANRRALDEVAWDFFQRRVERSARPLRKQYYEKRDDSDKLKLDSIEEE